MPTTAVLETMAGMIDALLAEQPEIFRDVLRRHWQQYTENAQALDLQPPQDARLLQVILCVWRDSEFVAASCARDPKLLADLLDSADLFVDYGAEEYPRRLRVLLRNTADMAELSTKLRRFRRREMIRIAWRDLAGWADLDETLYDLSRLADACVDEALALIHQWTCHQYGTPRDEDGNAQHMVVLGMGKLGAYELNYSSDIDLIFAFPKSGQTDGRREMTNEEFFTRVGRGLVEAIGANTADGFVFRVDVRLRPFGSAGPLAMSFDAMEEYYQTHAREWERYAMVKARPIAGDLEAGEQLMATLRPFVYRRYIDFGAFASLREMKALISAQLRRKGMGDNVKLGPGGIREIEFIGQAFQLIRGGRDIALQTRRIQAVLQLLADRDLMPHFVIRELREAYEFLRRTENRIQAWEDQQTHLLPETEEGRLRLALSMGFADWEAFIGQLDFLRERVQGHFDQTFTAPQGEETEEPNELMLLWKDALAEDDAERVLVDLGFADAVSALKSLTDLRHSHSCRGLGAQGRSRLDALMPLLLGAVAQADDPDATLLRVLSVIEAIGRRAAYFALLVENPMALSQLVRLTSASPWITRFLAQYPLLLDELLDPRTLYKPLSQQEMCEELSLLLRGVAPDDLEEQMERLRQFVHNNMLRVAAADVTDVLPLMQVSDHLSDIAEVCLQYVQSLAWQHMTERYGEPRCRDADGERVAGFAVLAYGKLGGLELGYGSDLDIVFLHDSCGSGQMTAGEQSIPNEVFFARLGQRVIHFLNTRTSAGQLYEVDTRLRPSGKSGLLVSSLDAFAQYQRDEAWTWEHQALVRARIVSGSERIAKRFEQIRCETLGRERREDSLRGDVSDMRERMRRQLGSKQSDLFNLKQDFGGIADIEFMVQYGALQWSGDHPELIRYTDNIRILAALEQTGLMAREDAELLAEAYRRYRAAAHRNSLQDRSAEVDPAEFALLREGVQRIWNQWMLQAADV